MKRVYANKDIPKVECTNKNRDIWVIRWDFQPVEGEDNLVSFFDYKFTHKPALQEIKSVILDWYNSTINEKIVSGFSWNDMPVWLSTENQFNYKVAYDLALQTEGKNLPVTFKFGTDENPVYYTFNNTEELELFYTDMVKYVADTLNDGWSVKESIDWSIYEKLLE